ncbi:MAG TPA: sugar phosphate isomerase/epimerase [Gemmatimonadaceae bacterium]|nr:sugar phosphate isomerase/epimerase [Gemmatimonadaceae bacterium]
MPRIDRRTFLRRLGSSTAGLASWPIVAGAASAVGAGALAGCDTSAAGSATTALLDRIGVQLYTLRTEMEKGVGPVLEQVARIGYSEVEFAGYFNLPPAELRSMLDANGLTAPSAHVDFNGLLTSSEPALDAAATLGHQWLVVAWLPTELRATLDDYKRRAEDFNRLGEACVARGMRFAYHNHDFEFAPLDGAKGYDTLLANCDPSLVDFELDLFWVTRAGQQPLDYFARAPGRFPMVHAKDMDGSPEHRMVDVGSGTIDFAAIFARGEQAGLRHVFVEHDEPADPWASVRASFTALRAMDA